MTRKRFTKDFRDEATQLAINSDIPQRQYFPKKTDLSTHSQKYLDRVAERLNMRRRKTLGFRTPADKLKEMLR